MKSIRIIPSKSDAHRAIICSGLADEYVDIKVEATSKDIEATRSCMQEIRKAVADGSVADLHCGESGSTFRFLIPVVAALGIKARFWPEGRLPERPLSPLYEELEKHGGVMSPVGTVPFEMSGRIEPGEYHIPGNVSSQYISGLIFALPLLDGDSRIVVEGKLESAGYVDMTLKTVRAYGIEIETVHDEGGIRYEISGGQTYHNSEYQVEGDWSNAAFWLVAGAIGAVAVEVSGLDMNSAQGDKRIVELLQAYGADVTVDGDKVTVNSGNGVLTGITVDVGQIPDMVPALALVASLAHGETRIENAGRLRIKESDRLKTVTESLRNLGADIDELEDSLVIRGVPCLHGGTVDSSNDHRIAMMAAIASLATDGSVVLTGADAVKKSYPGFFDDMERMGMTGNIERG